MWQLWRLQCWWPSDNHYRLLSSFLLVTRWRQAIIIQWFIIYFPIFNLNFFLVIFTIPFVGPKHVLKLRANRQTYRFIETLQVLSAPWSQLSYVHRSSFVTIIATCCSSCFGSAANPAAPYLQKTIEHLRQVPQKQRTRLSNTHTQTHESSHT